MPLRGGFYDATGVVACYEEASGGGDIRYISSPRNAPAANPAAHLDKLIWHSALYQYEIAAGPVDVSVTHTALATKDTWHTVSTGGYDPAGPSPSGSTIGFLIKGDSRVTDILLYTHGLGYVPKFMVSLDARRVPDGFIVQSNANGCYRRVSVFATPTGIYLREHAVSTDINLAAVSKTYRVMVFRTRAPDPAKALWSGSGASMQLARGIIDTTRRYLRRTGAGDSPFALNLGPTIDIKNGGARSASGGVVVSDPRYNGSMAAPAYVSVGV